VQRWHSIPCVTITFQRFTNALVQGARDGDHTGFGEYAGVSSVNHFDGHRRARKASFILGGPCSVMPHFRAKASACARARDASTCE
jgi:hypothetical protein